MGRRKYLPIDEKLVAKCKADVDRVIARATQDAHRHIAGIADGSAVDAEAPWSERTNRVAVNLKLVELASAERRVLQQAPTQAYFGVVMMQGRLPSTPEGEAQWETMHERQAIEAVEVKRDDVHAKELLGSHGVGEVARELGSDVRQAEAQTPPAPVVAEGRTKGVEDAPKEGG